MEIKGVITALVTPFSNGKVDYGKIRELVRLQIAAKVDGILPMGTTGESPTLSADEHLKVIETVIDEAKNRCLILAGTGANSTTEAIELTIEAKRMGAHATLQVTPYYNKPTQEGLYRHFSAVADEAGLPIVLYNIPGRCSVPIAIDTVARLSKNPLIVGIKEAAGSVERVSEVLEVCKISVMCGDDVLTIPMMSVGANGIISVASNLIPAELKAMVDAYAAGRSAEALAIHNKYFRLLKDLFLETNPIPIKAALAMKGLIKEEYRLPICPMSDKNRNILMDTMKKAGLL